MRPRILVSLAVLIALVVGLILLERRTRPADADTGASPTEITRPTAATVPTFTTPDATQATGSEDDPAATEPDPALVANGSPLAAHTGPDEVEDLPSVDAILSAPNDDLPAVAKQLAAVVTNKLVPYDQRQEALAHAINLSAGHESEVLTPLMADSSVTDEMAQTILSEALNNTLSYQADLYLSALAERKTPEMQTLIREHLAFLTDQEDLGPDPAAWKPFVEAAKKNWEE